MEGLRGYGRRSLIPHRFFAAEFDFAVAVDIDDLNHNLVPFLNFIGHFLDTAIADLRNMDQPVGAR